MLRRETVRPTPPRLKRGPRYASRVMRKKKKSPKLVPRRGPATNLRKAGAHADKKDKALKALDQKEGADLITLGSWAFEETE
jgi:hypothetical protein